ncbi:MAG: HEAT repeat domain-containing protein [Ignavibacteriaceae bacterium]
MKPKIFKPFTLIVAAALVIFFHSTSLAGFAENGEEDDRGPFKDASILSLKMGMESDIFGLKRCCIYLAGKYKIEETVDLMIELLDKEKNENIRVEIVLSLFAIGNSRGLAALGQLAETDVNPVIRRIGQAVLNQSDLFNISSASDY